MVPLGLRDMQERRASEGSDSGDSGGSADHELHSSMLNSYQEVEGVPQATEHKADNVRSAESPMSFGADPILELTSPQR